MPNVYPRTMLRLRPFAAVRPPVELAPRVAAVPYDVVNTAEARALAGDDPNSFLHVTRPDIDLPDGTDPYDDRMYAAAREAFERLQSEGALIREDKPCLYAYRQEAELNGRGVSQVGIVGCCHVEDYNEERIKKHEITRKAKEDDRTRHVLATRSNAGPVFLTHRDHGGIEELTRKVTDGVALYDFEAADGVRHTIWRIEDAEPFVGAFGELDCAYVADGHHRSASAARASDELRYKNPKHTGEEEYNWFLCVLFAGAQLNVLPYHRVVRDLGELDAAGLLEKLRGIAEVSDGDDSLPERPGSFGMYLDGRWHRVALPASVIESDDPVKSLDYVLLSEHILEPLLGIGDIPHRRAHRLRRRHPRQPGSSRAESTRETAQWRSAMRATSVEQLMRVADAGKIMPPKSTWFEPKLRSGLLVHTL